MHGRSITIRLEEIKRLMKENPAAYKKQLEQEEKEDEKEVRKHRAEKRRYLRKQLKILKSN